MSVDLPLLLKLNKPTPRYTSYPTAPEWGDLSPMLYQAKLKELGQKGLPLSLYFHIPFCKSMCLYCGCSVILNRKPENEERYVDYLIKEISLVCQNLRNKEKVAQLHFGGGTPTKLSIPLFARLFEHILLSFDLKEAQEIAIEIDPRTVIEDKGEKLKFLRNLGFNRVSFGIQDTNQKVQEAVKRHQSLEMTLQTYDQARVLGFKGVNVDLIYGLPYQTVQTFDETLSHILKMRPDRIAFFSYAKVPWLKPHQKAIPDATLPSIEEKFQIYANARARFIDEGYVAIGMDHFALEEDEMARAYKEKRLQRNFQGYSLKCAEDMLSFGVSSIGFAQGVYVQNLKELKEYYAALEQNALPIHRGKVLSEEDHLRKWVIHTLMCDFELDKGLFEQKFGSNFDLHFAEAKEALMQHEEDGLILNGHDKLIVTPIGELFVRIIASSFDAYLLRQTSLPKFSQAV